MQWAGGKARSGTKGLSAQGAQSGRNWERARYDKAKTCVARKPAIAKKKRTARGIGLGEEITFRTKGCRTLKRTEEL